MADEGSSHLKPARTYSAFPAFDPERYASDLEELDLESEQSAALLRALWDIAVILYEIGATEISIPAILEQIASNASVESADDSDSSSTTKGDAG